MATQTGITPAMANGIEIWPVDRPPMCPLLSRKRTPAEVSHAIDPRAAAGVAELWSKHIGPYRDDSAASRTGADALGHGVMAEEPPATRPWYTIR